jgi:hypothetical protein
VRDYQEALDNAPRQPILHLHLAVVEKAMGDDVGAKIEIERAYALSPKDYQVAAAAKTIEPSLLKV